MELIFYFLISLGISFLGSLPIGLITLTIVQRTMTNGKHAGLMISLGATIMEFVYTFIGIKSLDLFTKHIEIGYYIKIFATVLFFILGVFYFLKKPSEEMAPTKSYNYFDFLRGFVVGFMNLLIVPFWIFIGIWLESNGMIFEDTLCITSFSLGSAIGAFFAFLLYVWFSGLVADKLKQINKYTNKIIGTLLFGLGVFQLINLLS